MIKKIFSKALSIETYTSLIASFLTKNVFTFISGIIFIGYILLYLNHKEQYRNLTHICDNFSIIEESYFDAMQEFYEKEELCINHECIESVKKTLPPNTEEIYGTDEMIKCVNMKCIKDIAKEKELKFPNYKNLVKSRNTIANKCDYHLNYNEYNNDPRDTLY